MGTHSRIGVMHGDKVKSVYCHWDGYLEHNGQVLEQYYDSAKANNLEKHRHCKYARENRGRIALECAAENYEDVGADLRALTFKK